MYPKISVVDVGSGSMTWKSGLLVVSWINGFFMNTVKMYAFAKILENLIRKHFSVLQTVMDDKIHVNEHSYSKNSVKKIEQSPE